MDQTTKHCILCGGSRRNFLYSQDPWKVYQCADCKLGVLDPRPDDAELSRLYQQEYFHDQYKQELEKNYIPSFIARIIARLYSGHSYDVVAEKQQTG